MFKVEVKNRQGEWVLFKDHVFPIVKSFKVAYSNNLKELHLYGNPDLNRFRSIPDENFRVNGEPIKMVLFNSRPENLTLLTVDESGKHTKKDFDIFLSKRTPN